MSKSNYLLFGSITFLLLLAGGFFIGQKEFANAKEYVFDGLSNIGNCDLPWIALNCSISTYQGSTYIKMLKSDSILMSAAVRLEGYDSYSLSFDAKTYGTTTGEYKKIVLIVYSADDNSTTTILEAMPDKDVFQTFEVDLGSFSNKNIVLHFQTPNAQSNKGAAIYKIVTKGYSIDPIANQPPQPTATSNLNEAKTGDEIIFDGRNSADDGAIVDWYWNFGDGHSVYASTTSYAYGSSGVFNVYLSVTDDQGLTATSAPLYINISDPIIPTPAATTTPTSTPPEINPDDLVINEVYPSPAAGGNEWVEIFNNTSSTIDLTGLYLLNIDGGKYVTTTLSGLIESGAYKVIEDISGSLNNSGDTVVLRNIYPAGGLGVLRSISETAYGDFDGKSDASWARGSDGSYAETVTVTKGAANTIAARPAKASHSSGGGGSYAAISKTEIAPSAASTSPSATDYAGQIIVNEIYPNPNGGLDEEFIELLNLSATTIDLAGFIVMDGSKSKHLIKSLSGASSTAAIKPGGYFVFKRSESNIALNNTGVESVNLYSPDFKVLDRVEYLGENIKGVSYSRTDGGQWRWVKTATPGKKNSDDELYPDNENPALLGDAASRIKLVGVVKAAGKSAKAIQDATLERIKDFSAGDKVRAKGVVSVLPGVIGSQYFYIFDSNFGIQVYSNKKDFPDLQIGDYVEVAGELSDTSTGRRIKTASRDQIRFIARRDMPIAQPIAGAEIGEEYAGSLVSISGEMLEIKSRNIAIADGGDEVKVYINNQINLKDINAEPGDKITVTGIVGKTSSGYRLMPRDLKDIAVQKGEVKGDFATATDPTENNSMIYYLSAIIIFLIALIMMLFYKLKRK